MPVISVLCARHIGRAAEPILLRFFRALEPTMILVGGLRHQQSGSLGVTDRRRAAADFGQRSPSYTSRLQCLLMRWARMDLLVASLQRRDWSMAFGLPIIITPAALAVVPAPCSFLGVLAWRKTEGFVAQCQTPSPVGFLHRLPFSRHWIQARVLGGCRGHCRRGHR